MQSNESLGVLRLIFPLARAGRQPVIGWKHLGGPWPLSDFCRELSSGCITDWKGSDTTWELRMTFPLCYATPCTPSPYSIPPHTCPPLILSHCMHVLSCSLPAHTCHPCILFQLMHALLTPCHMNLEGLFLLWHLRMSLLNLLTLSISSSFT